MATEVLRPHDCFIHRFTVSPVAVHPLRKNHYGNRYSNPRSTTTRYRKRSPVKPVSFPARSRSAGELRRKRKSNGNGDDSYAGSAVVQSPSPRSVPLPSFFNRKQGSVTGDESFDDSASKHLRRLLRLDQIQ